MSLDPAKLQAVANLARLSVSEDELNQFAAKLNSILALNERLSLVDTTGVEPLSHPLELNQPLRHDLITEHNQRELFQKIAPLTKAGLYLVPQVMDNE